MKTEIKENRKLDLTGYAFSHQCYAFKPFFLNMYKTVLLITIHLKSDENTVPKSIFDLLLVSSITKGRINNILRSIEVYIIWININFFYNHNFLVKDQ